MLLAFVRPFGSWKFSAMGKNTCGGHHNDIGKRMHVTSRSTTKHTKLEQSIELGDCSSLRFCGKKLVAAEEGFGTTKWSEAKSDKTPPTIQVQ